MRGGIKSKLSVLAISVGIFSVCLISALGDTAAYEINERVAETGLGGITVYPGSSGKKLIDEQIMDDLSGIPGLKALTPFIYKTGKAECHVAKRLYQRHLRTGIHLQDHHGRCGTGGGSSDPGKHFFLSRIYHRG